MSFRTRGPRRDAVAVVAVAVAIVSVATVCFAGAAGGDACSLLTAADIAKATGIKVGQGAPGAPVPGTLGKCTWTGGGNTKVIVVLADAHHMQTTIASAEGSGGEAVSGVGSKAVGMHGAGFTGGGYIVNVLDAAGGFGVSVLGSEGTRERAVALAKLVQGHRHG